MSSTVTLNTASVLSVPCFLLFTTLTEEPSLVSNSPPSFLAIEGAEKVYC